MSGEWTADDMEAFRTGEPRGGVRDVPSSNPAILAIKAAARAEVVAEIRASVEGLAGPDRPAPRVWSSTTKSVAEFRAAVLALLPPTEPKT